MTFTPADMPKRRPTHDVRARGDHPLVDDGSGRYTLSGHAAQQATAKGWSHDEIADAANNPSITYDNGRFSGQKRHVKGDIVAVVHPGSRKVVTVYQNVKETDLRPDQTDHDARRYNARRMGNS
jgi:hypothetical protein